MLSAYNGWNETIENKLSRRFLDDNGDLIADPPDSPSEWLDPDPLVLAYYRGDDDGKLKVDWEGLRDRIAEATSKTVRLQPYLHTPGEIQDVASGKIHLVGAHSAEIPRLVNEGGLIPACELGSSQGADGNQLLIAAASQSEVQKLEDLRGKVLVCSRPDSIIGYRAAVVAIAKETGMLPGVDYEIVFSQSQERSIDGLAIRKFKFVALSLDALKRSKTQAIMDVPEFRVIHQTQVIPRLAVGYVHSLKPELAEDVTAAILGFENDGASEESKQRTRFIRVDYSKDYGFVRRLDDTFEPRFGQIFESGPSN